MPLPMPGDTGEIIIKEVRDFFRAELRTTIILMVLGTLSIAGGAYSILRGSGFNIGMAFPLLLFGGLFISIAWQARTRIPVRQQLLCARLLTDRDLAQNELNRTTHLHDRWNRMHLYALYILAGSMVLAIACTVMKSTGFVFGLGLAGLIESAICIALLLISRFRLQLYQHVLGKLEV